jgi:glutathione synthase/RimK-type ligase-like ATP-grasp enzyme
MVTDRLDAAGANYVLFNQREVADCDIWFEVSSQGLTGELRMANRTYRLEEFRSAYQRLMDDNCLPEMEGLPSDSPLRRHCRGFHDTLTRWLEIAPGLIVNRCAPMCSNSSKPYQTQLIRAQGFQVPETLITNQPELVRDFQAKHGRVIYKSASAVRSIVQTLEERDFERMENIRWCPTQFQAFVGGTNVRVHTIGGNVYATAIESEATDYRYASKQVGDSAELREVQLTPELSDRCLKLSRSLGLEFAGIDLKITPDDEVFCFEVNPSPAFSYFEHNANQPISEGLAQSLIAA